MASSVNRKVSANAVSILKPDYEMVVRSHCGLVREINEDRASVRPEVGMVVVADGMGGCNAGEVASQLAVEIIQQLLTGTQAASPVDAIELLEDAVATANQVVWDSANRSSDLAGMGTTVVVGLTDARFLYFAHVGDSRLYRWREGSLRQLTTDHSLTQALVDEGMFSSMAEANACGVTSNILTRALGVAETVEIDVAKVAIESGDTFLFCTDGLTNMLDDEELIQTMQTANSDLNRLADQLVARACNNGGSDNISVALLKMLGSH